MRDGEEEEVGDPFPTTYTFSRRPEDLARLSEVSLRINESEAMNNCANILSQCFNNPYIVTVRLKPSSGLYREDNFGNPMRGSRY